MKEKYLMKWTIPYNGRDWAFDDSRITASEARLQKRVTGGLAPADCDGARWKLDPDVWVAALLIAMRRAGRPDADVKDVDLDALELSAIVERSIEVTRGEQAEQRAAETPGEDAAPALPVAEPQPDPGQPEPAPA